MSRLKISEYCAKSIVNRALGFSYPGWQVFCPDETKSVSGYESYVVKVDQAIKGRFKKGLVLLEVKQPDLTVATQSLFDKGFNSLLVEPQVTHEAEDEKYLSLSRTRDGVVLSYSAHGGVNIEKHPESIKFFTINKEALVNVPNELILERDSLLKLYKLFNSMHISFLEINPYVILNKKLLVLDAAVEVDSSAELLVDGWDQTDVRVPSKTIFPEELVVQKLNKYSSASFSLEVMNENGAIFLLLSGGGASVVIADEIYTLGYGKQLANYGEYSGNPSEYETYQYTQQMISLVLKSTAPRKVLFIGGAVANFTNIATTFKGIIKALEENASKLQKEKIKVYVRRGGPHQAVGLKNIEISLRNLNIYGGVYDPTHSIPDAVKNMLKGLS